MRLLNSTSLTGWRRVRSDVAVVINPPVAAGTVGNQSYQEQSAIAPFDVSTDFTGGGLSFSLAPTSAPLPAGLTLSSAGVITGTPTTVAGAVTIVVRATNAGGTADTSFDITITEIVLNAPTASNALPDVSVNENEEITPINVYSDFVGSSIVYSLQSGTLPVGLSLSSSGIITGTPTTPVGPVSLVIRGSNNGGFADTAFDITVVDVPSSFAPVYTEFGSNWTTSHPQLWQSMQDNAYNSSMEHTPAETWDGFGDEATDGGVYADKTGNYPQIRFGMSVVDGEDYFVSLDLPVGRNGWNAAAISRLKIGDALNGSEHLQSDLLYPGSETIRRFVNIPVTGSSTEELYFAIMNEYNGGGVTGGDPALSRFRINTTRDTLAPSISNLSIVDGVGSIQLDAPARLYFRRDAVGTNPDADACKSGAGALETFTVDVDPANNTFTLPFAAGLNGTFQISVVAAFLPDGNPSGVLSADVAIDTVVATDVTLAAGTADFVSNGGASLTRTLSVTVTGDAGEVIIPLSMIYNNGSTDTYTVTATLDGNPCTTLKEPFEGDGGGVAVLSIAHPGASGTYDLVVTLAGTGSGNVGIVAQPITVTNRGTTTFVDIPGGTTATQNVLAGTAGIMVCVSSNSGDMAFVGLTEVFDQDLKTSDRGAVAMAEFAADETPRTMTAANSETAVFMYMESA